MTKGLLGGLGFLLDKEKQSTSYFVAKDIKGQ